jgi:signal transduction histidine kinase
MTLYDFLVIIYMLLALTLGTVLHYIPLRRCLRIKARTAAFLGWGMLLLFFTIPVLVPSLRITLPCVPMITAILYFLLIVPSAFCLLPGCRIQTLFVMSYHLCLASFILGLGNWLALWLEPVIPATMASLLLIIRIAIILLLMPFGVRSLNRIFTAWSIHEAAPFWKVVWMVPAALYTITMLSGNVLTLTEVNNMPFLLTRILSFGALQTCVVMMIGFMNRAKETAQAKMRKEMMVTTGKAHDQSHADTLAAWESMNIARNDGIRMTEYILTCAKAGSHDEIKGLLRARMAELNTLSPERICENEAVNALAIYYVNKAGKEGIDIVYKLDIPRQIGRIQNVDLSRIVGNMLENAIEACLRMDYGTKKIRLQSMIAGDMLVLGMRNSFDGDYKVLADGRYVSRKRDSGVATGLASVCSVADKYGGSVKFEAKDREFMTSVRLDMVG